MIKSMTGFSSRTAEDDVVSVDVTAKSVNHRFLDLQIRAASDLTDLESDLRALVQAKVARGRIDLAVTLRFKTPPSAGRRGQRVARAGALRSGRDGQRP